MKTLNRIDWNELNEYIENSLIVANKHPELDIWILNYTPKTQSKRFWDDYTLSCRGLVIDVDGKILARPFRKFMNIEEYYTTDPERPAVFDSSEIDMNQSYEIFEKVDGSLIIVFYYEPNNQWIVASRGSFISEQSMEARKMFGSTLIEQLNISNTYLFEVIFKENRIVVNYGDKYGLILLGVINTNTGVEVTYNEIKSKYSNLFEIVKKFDIVVENLFDLKKLEEDNKEGFVIRFNNGLRVKVKFNEYVRLHGILTNVSNLTVWEHLTKNYDFDSLLDRVPDEFYTWLKKTSDILQQNFNNVERKALKEFFRIYYVNDVTSRKEFAMEAIKTKHRAILFKMYDKKPYDEIIWKSIRPVFSKPFKDGYEYVS